MDKWICQQDPFRSVLAKHGYTEENLPTGVVIATSILSDCLGIGRSNGEHRSAAGDTGIHWIPLRSNEYAFGFYAPGRYAWKLEDVQYLNEPIPAKGQQGLWNWNENQV